MRKNSTQLLSPLSRGEGKQFEWSERSDQYSRAHLIEFI